MGLSVSNIFLLRKKVEYMIDYVMGKLDGKSGNVLMCTLGNNPTQIKQNAIKLIKQEKITKKEIGHMFITLNDGVELPFETLKDLLEFLLVYLHLWNCDFVAGVHNDTDNQHIHILIFRYSKKEDYIKLIAPAIKVENLKTEKKVKEFLRRHHNDMKVWHKLAANEANIRFNLPEDSNLIHSHHGFVPDKYSTKYAIILAINKCINKSNSLAHFMENIKVILKEEVDELKERCSEASKLKFLDKHSNFVFIEVSESKDAEKKKDLLYQLGQFRIRGFKLGHSYSLSAIKKRIETKPPQHNEETPGSGMNNQIIARNEVKLDVKSFYENKDLFFDDKVVQRQLSQSNEPKITVNDITDDKEKSDTQVKRTEQFGTQDLTPSLNFEPLAFKKDTENEKNEKDSSEIDINEQINELIYNDKSTQVIEHIEKTISQDSLDLIYKKSNEHNVETNEFNLFESNKKENTELTLNKEVKSEFETPKEGSTFDMNKQKTPLHNISSLTLVRHFFLLLLPRPRSRRKLQNLDIDKLCDPKDLLKDSPNISSGVDKELPLGNTKSIIPKVARDSIFLKIESQVFKTIKLSKELLIAYNKWLTSIDKKFGEDVERLLQKIVVAIKLTENINKIEKVNDSVGAMNNDPKADQNDTVSDSKSKQGIYGSANLSIKKDSAKQPSRIPAVNENLINNQRIDKVSGRDLSTRNSQSVADYQTNQSIRKVDSEYFQKDRKMSAKEAQDQQPDVKSPGNEIDRQMETNEDLKQTKKEKKKFIKDDFYNDESQSQNQSKGPSL